MDNSQPSKSIRAFIEVLIKRIQDSAMGSTSVGIAYFVTLSLFPILLVFGSIIPYLNISPDVIAPFVDSILPQPLVESISPIINDVLTAQSGGILSIGIIATIWAASAGMKYVRLAIDKAYGVENQRHYLSRAVSVVSFIVVLALLLVYMLAFSFGETLISEWITALHVSEQVLQSFLSLKWTIAPLTLFFTFTLIYKFTTNIRHRFRDVFAGSLFSTLAMIGMVQLYAVYLRSSTKLSAYGILSAVFVLLIWIRLIGYVIILGAALNAALHEYKYGKPQVKNSRIGDWIDNQVDKVLEYFNSQLQSQNNRKGSSE